MQPGIALASLVVLGGHLALSAEEGPLLVLERSQGGHSCRAATGAERTTTAVRPGNAPVHVLARSRESLAASAGLHIVLRATDQLETRPDAKAAFLRAASRRRSTSLGR